MTRRLVPLEVLREAFRVAVEQDGLRPVARAVRMTPTGLTKALAEGQKPHATTLRKMREWYIHRGLAAGPDATTAYLALEALLEGVPAQQRHAGIERLVGMVREIYKESGIEAPEWVEKLLD